MGVRIEYSEDGKKFRYVDTPEIDKSQKGKSIIADPNKYVVIDIETTGLDSEFCHIIEIGALKVENDEVIDKFSSLVKPIKWYYSKEETDENTFIPIEETEGHYYVDDFITKLTGITNEMLEEAPEPTDILPAFKQFVGNNIIVGHNVSFDISFIYTAFMRELNVPFTNSFIDTMRMSRRLFKEKRHHRLCDTAEYCGVKYAGAHRALADCEITQACYAAMHKKIVSEFPTFDDFKALFNNLSKLDVKSIKAQTDCFDEEHPFYGKNIVFTGALQMPRKEAMQAIVNVGAIPENNVTSKTNYLIVGSFDYIKSIKGGKSSKIKKAEKMILDGYDISIISENTFNEIMNNDKYLLDESMKQKKPKEYVPSSFGCCSRYEQCSDAMKCLHPDEVYSMQCAYRKNLESGKIFYGKNKNYFVEK